MSNKSMVLKDLPFYSGWQEIINRIRAGTITIEELTQEWVGFLASKDIILAQLSSLTNAELQRYSMNRGDKKNLVHNLWYYMCRGFLSASKDTGWWPTQESVEGSITRNLGTTTQEDLVAYAQKVVDTKAKNEKIITNPETYEELDAFVDRFGEDKLTFEQWLAFNSFVAYKHLERAEQQREEAAKVEKIELDGDLEFVIRKDFHTKHQCDIWVVKLNRRVDRPEWKEIDAKASRFGARWSSWGPMENHGWIFRNEDDLAKFLDLQNGDGTVIERWNRRNAEKQERAVDRLQSVALTLEEAALEELNKERKTNTVRRADQAENAYYDAQRDIQWVTILRGISTSIDTGSLVFLRNLRFATQVRLLETILQQAKYAAIRTAPDEGRDRDVWNRIPVLEDIRFAKYPWPRCSRYAISRLKSELRGRRGAKSILYTLEACQDRSTGFGIDWVSCENGSEALQWEKALEYVSNDEVRDSLHDWRSLSRMGIKTIYTLRAALAEYMLYRPEVEDMCVVDKIKIAELQIVGWKIAGFFPTPTWLAEKMVMMADIQYDEHGVFVLEPSAGTGRIADAIRSNVDPQVLMLDTCEVNSRLRDIIKLKGFSLVGSDFLDYVQPTPVYDYILMNPPFENGQDMEHVTYAYNNHLKPGGRLVAIMGEHAWIAIGCQDFRDWLEEHDAYVEKLPEGTFKESGTGTNTRLVMIDKEV